WSFFTEFWTNIYEQLRSVGEDVWDIIYEDINAVFGDIPNVLDDLGSMISAPLQDLWDVLNTFSGDITSWFSDIYSAFQDIPSAISREFQDIFDAISFDITSSITSLSEFVSSSIESSIESATSIFEEMSSGVWSGLQGLQDAFSSSIAGLQDAIATALPDLTDALNAIPDTIVGGFEGLITSMLQGATNILGIVLPQAEDLFPGHTPGWVEEVLKALEAPFKGLADVLYSSILAKLEYEPPATEEKVREAVKSYLATVFEISLSTHLAALAADNIKYFDKLGLQDILRSLFFNLGLNWLTWVIFAEPFRAIITEPMSEIYREKYRTNRATKSELLEAWRYGMLSEIELAERLARMGYPDEDIAIIELAALKPASESDIEEAYRRGIIDRETYRDYLSRLGYLDWAIDIKEELVWRDVSPSTLIEAWQRGYITYDELIDRLRAQGYTDDAANLYALTRSEDLSPSMLIRAYLRGLITYEECVNRLVGKGYSPDAAELYISLYSEDETSEERKLTKSEIIRLFTLGLINRDEAKSMLIDIGYSPESAEYLISLQEAKEESSIRELRIKAIMDDYRDNVISEEEARKRLLAIGVSPARIDALIDYYRARKERPPPLRRPSKSDILRAYKAGIIDIDTADILLEEIGYRDPFDRALLLTLYAPGFPEEPSGEEVIMSERA
ncbi:MAG: phage tail protein, partial [Candidatus Nezhaarchaeales archaeon]